MTTKFKHGIHDLEKKYGPMTLGFFIKAIREADEISQSDFAKKLKLSRANLCDIEKGRKIPTASRAAKIAKLIGMPAAALVQLAIQDQLRAEKLNFKVELSVA